MRIIYKKYLLLNLFLLICLNIAYAQSEQFIVGGCGYDKISVINRAGDILWSNPIKSSNCNDIQITEEGNILYADGVGAYLVGRDKKTIWSHLAKSNEEIYSATQQENGEYVLAFGGHPARIVELSKSGHVIKEIELKIDIENVHSQLRQISKKRNGNYIVPVFSEGIIFELDSNGELLRKLNVGGTPFQVNLISNKRWLVGGGDGNSIILVNAKTGETIREIKEFDIKDCTLLFVAEVNYLKNKNILFANWSGHDRDSEAQPIVVEINEKNEIVWSLSKSESLDMISTIYPIEKRHNF